MLCSNTGFFYIVGSTIPDYELATGIYPSGMIRTTAVFLTLILLIGCSAKTKKSWTEADKKLFLQNCIENSRKGLGERTESYCNCLLDTTVKKYPDAKKAMHLSMGENLDLMKNCLKGWTAYEQKVFIDTCIAKSAYTLGAEKAKSYCDCMLIKVRKKYPDAIHADELKVADAIEMAKGCQ